MRGTVLEILDPVRKRFCQEVSYRTWGQLLTYYFRVEKPFPPQARKVYLSTGWSYHKNYETIRIFSQPGANSNNIYARFKINFSKMGQIQVYCIF